MVYGECVDIPFPKIVPEADEKEINALTDIYAERVLSLAGKECITVHLMGEQTFCYSLINKLLRMGIKCIASTTYRDSTILPDGSKKDRFHFIRFRSYVWHAHPAALKSIKTFIRLQVLFVSLSAAGRLYYCRGLVPLWSGRRHYYCPTSVLLWPVLPWRSGDVRTARSGVFTVGVARLRIGRISWKSFAKIRKSSKSLIYQHLVLFRCFIAFPDFSQMAFSVGLRKSFAKIRWKAFFTSKWYVWESTGYK